MNTIQQKFPSFQFEAVPYTSKYGLLLISIKVKLHQSKIILKIYHNSWCDVVIIEVAFVYFRALYSGIFKDAKSIIDTPNMPNFNWWLIVTFVLALVNLKTNINSNNWVFGLKDRKNKIQIPFCVKCWQISCCLLISFLLKGAFLLTYRCHYRHVNFLFSHIFTHLSAF